MNEADNKWLASGLLSVAGFWLWELDADYRFVRLEGSPRRASLQDALSQALGCRPWEIPGITAVSAGWRDQELRYRQHQTLSDVEYEIDAPDGERLYVSISGAPRWDAQGCFSGYAGFARDVTAEVNRRRLLAQTLASQASTLQALPDLLFEFDAEGRYRRVHVPPGAQKLVYNHQAVGQLIEAVVPVDVANSLRQAMATAANSRQTQRLLYRLDIHGEETWFDGSLSIKIDPASGQVTGYIAMVRDVTQRVLDQRRLEQLLYRDSLTGLPSKAAVDLKLRQFGLESGKPLGADLLLIKLDPSGITPLNAQFGQLFVDDLLKAIAQTLQSICAEQGLWCARTMADRFTVLGWRTCGAFDAATSSGRIWAVERMERLQSALESTRFKTAIGDLRLRFMLGAHLLESGSEAGTVEEALRSAYLAMLDAKADGQPMALFSAERSQRYLDAIQLRSELAMAPQQGQLRLHWQAIVDDKGYEVAREALIRWQHPERGLLYPGNFIELVEQSDLAIGVGQWVLGEALKQRRQWLMGGCPTPRISVNVSARQVQMEGFADQLADLLKQHDCPAEALQLEFTEGELMKESAALSRNLDAIRALGVHLALDDFGTGYSSLGYLHRLPLTVLKIDKTFVRDMMNKAQVHRILRMIVELAQDLDLVVVAEGVETTEQLNALKELNIKRFQGYLFGRPQPLASHCRG